MANGKPDCNCPLLRYGT